MQRILQVEQQAAVLGKLSSIGTKQYVLYEQIV